DADPSARARRHAVEPDVLIELVGYAIQVAVWRPRRTDREPRDLLCGVQVPLGEQRRQLQHAGDVVEAVADFVGRQHRRAIDVEREQVAYGVLIFRPVQTMKRLGASRIWMRRGGSIERSFERRREAVD